MGHDLQPAVARLIQAQQPEWTRRRAICPRCVLRFVEQLQAERSASSLQSSTTPPSTFPYYHAAEETILPQASRLPDYGTFDGRGVTVAFLDSGYYPHPDLSALAEWADAPAWETLDAARLHAAISHHPMRLAHYVDLTNEGRVEGLDAPSLWDGAGDSWHGQMTSVVALGNGLLSGGHFRGYASGANALPIKIGRGGGRIPEADILRGLQWLLHQDRWERYGVRVLNVSVGGDFDEPWYRNAVSLAAEELSRRGVLIAAAAGNRGHDIVLPPVQSPSVLTVGGVDDFNRRWSPLELDEIAQLDLYHHNWTEVRTSREHDFETGFALGDGVLKKPEVLALARWLPSPILLPHPILAEMVAIGRQRERLLASEEMSAGEMAALFSQLPGYRRRRNPRPASVQRAEFWRSLRRRMNAHKWVHPYYQHVDGTSVAVAQVSAVAAQMVQANSALAPTQIKQLLMQSALPLSHLPDDRTGAGLIQPTRAVAVALRAEGGRLAGLPISGTSPEFWPAAPKLGEGDARRYVGLWAPHGRAVSVVGDFNSWQVGAWPLVCVRDGWWHGTLHLPPGAHVYRFWVEGESGASWMADPENPARAESGYSGDHSVLQVAR
jgi:serine protease AprX